VIFSSRTGALFPTRHDGRAVWSRNGALPVEPKPADAKNNNNPRIIPYRKMIAPWLKKHKILYLTALEV
jgi:hypothetical protein